jgi:hypothetical protein
MKKSIRFALLIFITALFSCPVNAQIFQWAQGTGGSSTETGDAIATDHDGNSYVTGKFRYGDFGSFSLTSTSAFVDIFIAKYDSSGTCLWAKRAGGPGNDYAYDIAIDSAGNCYVTGQISAGGPCDFDTTHLTSHGQADIFVAKYDANGNCIWARDAGGGFDDIGYAIDLDAAQNVYITGECASSAIFGTHGASAGAIVAQYSSTGSCNWVRSFANSGDSGNGLAVDSAGNCYFTGEFQGTAAFGPFTLTSAGSLDFFVAKCNNAGTCLWAKRAGGTSFDVGNAIVIDRNGNSYVTGYYAGTINFLCNTFTNSSTGFEIFIVKYDSNGNCQWATRAIGGNGGWGMDLVLDSANNFYITGWYQQTFTFGSFTLTSTGGMDIFLAKYSPSGTCLGVASAGGTGTDKGHGISVDGVGKIYITGEFSSTAQFGSFTLVASSSTDIYIAKYDLCNAAPMPPLSITGSTMVCNGSSNSYTASPIAGATSYTWTLPGGWTGSSNSNSITSTAGNTGGTITVTANNACGSSPVQTLAVTVNTNPAMPGAISGAATICSGSNNTYSITPVAGATSYTWTIPPGWTGTSTADSISTTANATSGNITVTATNSCGTSPAQTVAVTVNTNPAMPGAISGATTICSGSINTYSITAVAGATSYTWTIPSGWTGTSTTNSISTTANATNGNITVTADNTCGTSPAQTVAIAVNTNPATPGAISGTATICSGSINIYSITAVAGATSYTWTLPSGWTGTSTTNSISITANATSGNITVTADNTCGTSPAQTLAVNVNLLPVVSYVQTPSTACINWSPIPLSAASPAGGNYNGPGVTGNQFDPATAGMGTHNVVYTYTDTNGCANSATQEIVVDLCSGINQSSDSNDLAVFPNPCIGTFTVILSRPEPSQLIVTNILGEWIYFTQLQEGKNEIDLSKQVPGIYFVTIKSENRIETKKIIKE